MSKFDEVLLLPEVAEKLGVSESTIKMRMKAGTIPERFYKKAKGIYKFDSAYLEYAKK
jgi:predicted DNA-binding transcriptional regulator AlpA